MEESKSDKQFQPDQLQIEQALELMPKEDQNPSFELDPDLCDQQPFEEHFLCGICTMVVIKPEQCGNCEKLHCEKCMQTWIQKSATCPQCRAAYQKQNVNRFAKNILDQLSFRCSKPDCQKSNYLYRDAQSHTAEHSIVSMQCFLNCGSQRVFRGKQEMQSHLQTECQTVLYKCLLCDESLPKHQISTHKSCEAGLIALVKSLREQLALKDLEIQTLKQGQQLVCPKNHKMIRRVIPTPRNVLGIGFSLTEFVNCDKCRAKVCCYQGFYNCGDKQCDWDLCLSCAGDQPDPNTRPFCLKQHPMKVFTLPMPRLIYSGTSLNCNGPQCGQSIQLQTGYFHCGNSSCDYDLCKACGVKQLKPPMF